MTTPLPSAPTPTKASGEVKLPFDTESVSPASVQLPASPVTCPPPPSYRTISSLKLPTQGAIKDSAAKKSGGDKCIVDKVLNKAIYTPELAREEEKEIDKLVTSITTSPINASARVIKLYRYTVSAWPHHEFVVCEFERSDGQRFFLRSDRNAAERKRAKDLRKAFAPQDPAHTFVFCWTLKQTHMGEIGQCEIADMKVYGGPDGTGSKSEGSIGGGAVVGSKSQPVDSLDIRACRGPTLGECLEISSRIIKLLDKYMLFEQNCWCYSFLIFLLYSFRLVGVVQADKNDFSEERLVDQLQDKVNIQAFKREGELWTIGKQNFLLQPPKPQPASPSPSTSGEPVSPTVSAEPSGLCFFIHNRVSITNRTMAVVIFGDRQQYPTDLIPSKTILDPSGLEEFLKSEGGAWLTGLSRQWTNRVGTPKGADEVVKKLLVKVEESIQAALTRYLEQYLLPTVRDPPEAQMGEESQKEEDS